MHILPTAAYKPTLCKKSVLTHITATVNITNKYVFEKICTRSRPI